MPIIEVENLKKTFRVRTKKSSLFKSSYKNINAVNNISFSVEPGECIAFIGPNGAGKSTTLKMLSAILSPTSGKISVLGLTPWENRQKLAYHIGAVFGQRSQLWYHLPAKETFQLLAAVYDIPPTIYQKRLKKLIEEFQIQEFIDKPVRSLSLGERIRCEIAASLLHDPQILFLDEPTIGLDVSAKASIRELLKRQAKEENKTIILTSHDTGDMESVSKRVLMINHGKIVIDDTVKKLRQTHLKRKRLSITTETKLPKIKLPGVRIVEESALQSVLEIDTDQTPIGQVMQTLMSNTGILDLTVEDPPMEEIIKDIYAREAEND